MNRSAEQEFMWFVCPAVRFIPHEPRKKDTHSLSNAKRASPICDTYFCPAVDLRNFHLVPYRPDTGFPLIKIVFNMRFAFTHGAQESFDGKVRLPEGQKDVKLCTGKSTGASKIWSTRQGCQVVDIAYLWLWVNFTVQSCGWLFFFYSLSSSLTKTHFISKMTTNSLWYIC